MFFTENVDPTLGKQRRANLMELLAKTHERNLNTSCVVLFASYDEGNEPFLQDSTFMYFTGLEEPALVVVMDFQGTCTIFAPRYSVDRASWTLSVVKDIEADPARFGFKEFSFLGAPVAGHTVGPWFTQQGCINLIETLAGYIKQGGTVFASTTTHDSHGTYARVAYDRLCSLVPGLLERTGDMAALIAALRRRKEDVEFRTMLGAATLTVAAHMRAAGCIKSGVHEHVVRSSIDHTLATAGSWPAFPTIVASGASTLLPHHRCTLDKELKDGELVIVDCGARIDNYCADVSRTYPVSGKFTAKQKKLYNFVLGLHEELECRAVKGAWLSNERDPDNSLFHVAKKIVERQGYGPCLLHGIGHFVGLDVHDVGSHDEPLRVGDVITIEPGIYVREEGMGIRIEDMYLITEDGHVCLSTASPRGVRDIERLMADPYGCFESTFGISHDNDKQPRGRSKEGCQRSCCR